MGLVLAATLCAFIALANRPAEGPSWVPIGGDAAPADAALPETPRKPETRRVEVERGDTLGSLLIQEGASADDARAAAAALAGIFDPSGLRGGQVLTLVFAAPRHHADVPALETLAFRPDVERDIAVRRQHDGRFEARETLRRLTAAGTRARGVIDGSLYQSARDAGVPDSVVVDMIRVYSHAVDFQREIRAGDRFDILYTTYTDESGAVIKGGAIDFVQLTLSGKAKPLYRFTSPSDQTTDYHSPDGHSSRRLLMRTPVDGARLSSGFGLRRHPVLGYSKMHKGVDFAAPTGTPVMAAGNGTVAFAGWYGSFGNYVRIAHAGGYETAYAHLSRIDPGLRKGARVRQGQRIGRVGSTGRSTGPHLHYEVLARARQINPMDVRLPTGTTLAGADLAAFRTHVASVNAVLDNWGEATAFVAQGDILRAKLLP